MSNFKESNQDIKGMRNEPLSCHAHMMCGLDMKVIRLHRDRIELEMSPFTLVRWKLECIGKVGQYWWINTNHKTRWIEYFVEFLIQDWSIDSFVVPFENHYNFLMHFMEIFITLRIMNFLNGDYFVETWFFISCCWLCGLVLWSCSNKCRLYLCYKVSQ